MHEAMTAQMGPPIALGPLRPGTSPRFPTSLAALTDPGICPWCGALHGGATRCAACGFPLDAPEAERARGLSRSIDSMLRERADLLGAAYERGRREDRAAADARRARLADGIPHGAPEVPLAPPLHAAAPIMPSARSPFATPLPMRTAPAPRRERPAPQPAQPPVRPARQGPRRSPVQILLLALGVGLMSIAAIFFAVFAWIVLDRAGRAIVTAAATAAIIAAASIAARFRLRATAEGLASLAVVLLVLDAWGVFATDLIAVSDRGLPVDWGVALIVVGGICATWAALSSLRAPSLAASILIVPGIALAIGGSVLSAGGAAPQLWGLLGGAAGALAHPLFRRLRAAQARPGEGASSTASAPSPLRGAIEEGIVAGLGLAALGLATIAWWASVDGTASPLVLALVALALSGLAIGHWLLARRTLPAGPWVAPRAAFLVLAAFGTSSLAIAIGRMAAEVEGPAASIGIAARFAIGLAALGIVEGARQRWSAFDRIPLLAASAAAGIAPALDVVGALGTLAVRTIALLGAAGGPGAMEAALAAGDGALPHAVGSLLGLGLGVGAIVRLARSREARRTRAVLRVAAPLIAAVLLALLLTAIPSWPVAFAAAVAAVAVAVAAAAIAARRALADPGASGLAIATLIAVAPPAAVLACLSAGAPWAILSSGTLLAGAAIVLALWRRPEHRRVAQGLAAAAASIILALAAALGTALALDDAPSPHEALPAAAAVLALALCLGAALAIPAVRRRAETIDAVAITTLVSGLGASVIAATLSIIWAPADSGDHAVVGGCAAALAVACAAAAAVLAPQQTARPLALALAPVLAAIAIAALLPIVVPIDDARGAPRIGASLLRIHAAAAVAALGGALASLALRWRRGSLLALDGSVAVLALAAVPAAIPIDGHLPRAGLAALSATALAITALDRRGVVANEPEPPRETARRHLAWPAPLIAAYGLDQLLLAARPDLDASWRLAAFALVLAGTAGVLILDGDARRTGEAPIAALIAVIATIAAAGPRLWTAIGASSPLEALAAPAALLLLLALLAATPLAAMPGLALPAIAVAATSAVLLVLVAAGRAIAGGFRAPLAAAPGPAVLDALAPALIGLALLGVAALAWTASQARIRPTPRAPIARIALSSGLATLLLAVLLGQGRLRDAPIAATAGLLLALLAIAAVAVLAAAPARAGARRLLPSALPEPALFAALGCGLVGLIGPIDAEGAHALAWGRLELIVLPIAAGLLAAGARRMGADRRARSMARLGPGLAVLFAPMLAADLVAAPGERLVLVGALAVASVLVGAIARLQAPLILGSTALAIHAIVTFWPVIVAAYQAVPWWAWLAIAGSLLVVVATTYEARLRDARRAIRSIGGLR